MQHNIVFLTLVTVYILLHVAYRGFVTRNPLLLCPDCALLVGGAVTVHIYFSESSPLLTSHLEGFVSSHT